MGKPTWGKWSWQCTTTGIDISTELRTEKVHQAVTEIWVPQIWQPPTGPPARTVTAIPLQPGGLRGKKVFCLVILSFLFRTTYSNNTKYTHIRSLRWLRPWNMQSWMYYLNNSNKNLLNCLIWEPLSLKYHVIAPLVCLRRWQIQWWPFYWFNATGMNNKVTSAKDTILCTNLVKPETLQFDYSQLCKNMVTCVWYTIYFVEFNWHN